MTIFIGTIFRNGAAVRGKRQLSGAYRTRVGFLVEVVATTLGEIIADLKDEMDQHRKEAREALSEEVRKPYTELCDARRRARQVAESAAVECGGPRSAFEVCVQPVSATPLVVYRLAFGSPR